MAVVRSLKLRFISVDGDPPFARNVLRERTARQRPGPPTSNQQGFAQQNAHRARNRQERLPDGTKGATSGATLGGALTESEDLLRILFAATVRESESRPKPSRGSGHRHRLAPSAPAMEAAADGHARHRLGSRITVTVDEVAREGAIEKREAHATAETCPQDGERKSRNLPQPSHRLQHG